MTSFKLTSQPATGITDIQVADPAEGSTSPLLFFGHRLHFDHWGSKEPGTYVLIAPLPTEDGKYRMYVGESTRAGVAGRINQHVQDPPRGMESWQFAVGVRGEMSGGREHRLMFEHAQSLESELYDELSKASYVELLNKSEPSKIPLTKPDHQKLEHFTKCCLELLEYLGYYINSRPDAGALRKLRASYQQKIVGPPPPPPPPPPTKSGELAAMIEAGVVQVGTRLVSKSKKYPCEAEIADANGYIQVLRYGKDEHGNWQHELSDDPKYRYKSLSGATKVIVEFGGANNDADGWRFWRLADDPKISMGNLRDQHKDQFGDSASPALPLPKRPSAKRGELAAMIEAGVVQVGTRLVNKGKKHACEAEIVDAAGHIQVLRYGKDEYGNWQHELSGNPKYRFKSLNGSTQAIVDLADRKAPIDGWNFWRLAEDPTVSMKQLKDQYKAQYKDSASGS